MRIRPWLLLNPAPTEGGNGSTQTTEATKPETASTTTTTTTTKADGFEALAAKHSNDGVGLARNLWDQLQAANAKVTELSGKVAPDGAVVLKGDQAKAWSKYTSLGKPEEIETALSEGTAAKGDLAKLNRRETIRTVAGVAEFDADVLTTLAGDLEFEVVDETVKGKTVKVAKVKAGETSTPLADYAATNWPKFLPSLKAGSTPAPKLGTPAPRNGTTTPARTLTTTSQGADEAPKERLIPFGRF